ncbi:MAG: envelope stress response membrane protein PspC [Pseudomonadota bacterium]
MPKQHHHHHHYYYDDRGNRRHGYAFHAGEPGPGPNRHRLYRNMRDGKIAGVCAGLADYFGIDVKWVRIALIFSVLMSGTLTIFGYIVAAMVLKPGEPMAMRYGDPEEERFWRTYSVRPKATFSELKHRFRALDARVTDMERAVTSDEFGLRREFRNLERGV